MATVLWTSTFAVYGSIKWFWVVFPVVVLYTFQTACRANWQLGWVVMVATQVVSVMSVSVIYAFGGSIRWFWVVFLVVVPYAFQAARGANWQLGWVVKVATQVFSVMSVSIYALCAGIEWFWCSLSSVISFAVQAEDRSGRSLGYGRFSGIDSIEVLWMDRLVWLLWVLWAWAISYSIYVCLVPLVLRSLVVRQFVLVAFCCDHILYVSYSSNCRFLDSNSSWNYSEHYT